MDIFMSYDPQHLLCIVAELGIIIFFIFHNHLNVINARK